MAKIFGILTAIVLAIACFVALKNKAHYQTEIENRQAIEKKLEITTARLDTANKNLAATTKEHDDVKAEIPKRQAEETAQKATNAELTSTKETKNAEVEANKAKLQQIEEKTKELGNIKDLAAKMGTMSNQLKETETAISTNEAKLANVTTENSRVESIVAKQTQQAQFRSAGESFPTLKTSISSIYPNWGFVTLAAGNAAGVITNSTLDVIRNDEVIAKLLVTAVESNTSSASIIPESVKGDTVLMVGDRVIPGAKIEAPVKTSSPAPATAPAR